MNARLRFFSVAITLVSRVLLFRDSLLGVTARLRKPDLGEDFVFASGDRRLAATIVPAGVSAPWVLICHGIGETVLHWSAVQTYLRERGVGSMVFNYSGYGASSGGISVANCEEDLVSAYAELRRRAGPEARIFVLGFSLGSGIAGNGAGALTPPPAGLFLCEAFTSFREAAHAGGCAKWLTRTLPDIWNTVEAVRRAPFPVCVVHSDADRLFPLEMPRRIVAACGDHGELIVVRGLSHDEPYRTPTNVYWEPIVARMLHCDSPPQRV